ncbi:MULTISPECIES: LysR substrate-binding domain-containing protein [unclassified Brenneria]|uniref:LysR family transcriptional regulator n=1 Tax=unclassified Brenneria TaxID=2634434 RepID=UPI0029C26093|nr:MULTISPECIES: LysR substrate-binding domain-containing protein [unclassified Brenneria]MDX5629642.1 LysR substrate-binding domain-containing protein [Brenneria sp. L3-3Z]MDX5696788.1 LysR substrate-binding domain-containing protein [Brenneria sp. L4-2C]
MLSLRQLQQFLAVAETMNYHRAAERLNMAQPPLTAAIRNMEDALGVRLFERTHRITGLTAAGEVLQEEARRTLAQMARAETLTRRAGQGLTGSLRIGFVASAVRHRLPAMVAGFSEQHPEVALDLHEATTARQIKDLLEDRLDIAIVALPVPGYAASSLALRPLLSSRLVAAVPQDHALAGATSLTIGALAGEAWVMFPQSEGPGLYQTIHAACERAGFIPRVAQRAVQMETILGLVAAGLGIALVPEFMQASGWENVAFRPLEEPDASLTYEVAFAWRKQDNTPLLTAFVAYG